MASCTNIFCIAVLLFVSGCASTNSLESDEESMDEVETPVSANPPEEHEIEFIFPLKNYKRIARGFKKKHKGIDVSADKGTPIYAAESGWILYTGRQFKGYGKLVIVEHSKMWATFYGHMSTIDVSQGKWVNKGDILGYVGRTGRATGNHLHFEIRRQKIPIDPMLYFSDKK